METAGEEFAGAAYTGGSTTTLACFMPHRRQRKRRATACNGTIPRAFTAAIALSVLAEWQ